MISFSKLGEYGRLGNQLFQYAYLRTQARRLHTKFYCPAWKGEEIFLLNDQNEKGGAFPLSQSFTENPYKHGFYPEALEIKDGTDVAGYFQSEKFFKKEDVLAWFTFKEELFSSLREKYKDIDWGNATALHIRLGDYLHPSLMFYTPTPEYYKKAIRLLNARGPILVITDSPAMVKAYLGKMPEQTIFIEGNKDYEDFYLLTLCKNVVCSASSFSWWGAYLNKTPGKRVVMPDTWFVPFGRVTNNDIFVAGWERLRAHRSIADTYYFRYIKMLFGKLFPKR